MPTTVAVHQLHDLSNGENKNEILLDTKLKTELHIIVNEDKTIIRLPYGNRFDIVSGAIIIYDENETSS